MLENKVQDRDQPALNYFLEVLTLCKRYEPNITEKQIIGYIIQGLQPELCERILNERNDSLDELEDNLKKVELQLKIQTQNREKYMRVTNKGDFDHRLRRRSVDDRQEELRNIQTEIKTLTNIVSNLSLQRVGVRVLDKESGQQGRAISEERRGSSTPTLRRGTSPIEDRRNEWRRDPGDYQRGRRETHYPDRRNNYYTGWTDDRRRDRSSSFSRNNYRQPQKPQVDKRVTFNQREWRGRSSSGSRDQERRQDTGRRMKLCTFCGRNNHEVWECRIKKSQETKRYHRQNIYCEFCRMNNHTTSNCFKRNKNQKKTNLEGNSSTCI